MVIIYAVLLTCIGNSFIAAITTIHHNKPDSITISTIETSAPESSTDETLRGLNVTLSSSERKKRLLPYQNFYFNQPFNRPHKAGVSAQQYKDFDNVRKPPKKIQQEPMLFRPADTGSKFTPFLESNALPGPFRPMINLGSHPNLPYVVAENPVQDEEKAPHNVREQESHQDLSAIYEKLAQLKLRQQSAHQKQPPYGYRLTPQFRFRQRPQKIPQGFGFSYEVPNYNIQPTKTTIETFTATNIDIPDKETGEVKYESKSPGRYHHVATPVIEQNVLHLHTKFTDNTKPFAQQQIAFEVPQPGLPLAFTQKVAQKPSRIPNQRPKAYIVIQQNRPKQPAITISKKPKPTTIVEENYVAKKFIPVVFTKPQHYQYQRPGYQPSSYQDNYEVQHQATPASVDEPYEAVKNFVPAAPPEAPQEYDNYYHYQTQTQTPISSSAAPPVLISTSTQKAEYNEGQELPVGTKAESEEKTTSLAELLKQLQDSNALPQTLTADNIDNSIKTLVRILNALKDRQKQTRPVIVHDEYEYDNEAGVDLGGDIVDTPDGGTPGKPGVDYPALSNIPKTTFSCKTQRYKGFFGDPDTNCQVWHYCDLNGGQASFLCPNGTIFSQVALTCDWWYNVKCASTPQLYVLNERLYKYIIPLSPKFPEDYSGPLVDKYLAMKFQEMEEKLKKQKKGKGNQNSEDEDSIQSDDVEEEEEGDSSNEESRLEGETERTVIENAKSLETTTAIVS